jgi:hypothetical protein
VINLYRILDGRPQRKSPLRRPRQKREFPKGEFDYGLDLCSLGYGTVASCCEHRKGLPDFMEGGTYLDQLSDN